MNSIPSVSRVLGIATLLLAISAFATPASQAQIAAPAAGTAQNSFCGNQALCYDANDFAATITDFRTSTQGGYKVIDVIVRFQNKTNQPLALGYLAGSGTALDDRGNRYIVYGGNGFRGIGQVYGNNFDPKFSLRPGGFGDAQFELMWAPGQTVYGLTFELNLTVDEIQTVEGNQHTLGGEIPLHFRGLANGVAGGAASGQATAFSPQGQGGVSSIPGLPPCGTTATTLANTANSSGVQVPAGANTAVSNATTAFSNLGSIFKKKAAAPAPAAAQNTAASAAPCAPAATDPGTTSATTMTPGTTSMSPANGTATQSAGATAKTSTTTTAPAPVAKTATTRNTTTAANTTATTAKPVPVVAKAPVAQPTAAVKKPVATPAPQKPAATTPAVQKSTMTNQ
jgi:hypothetical protein